MEQYQQVRGAAFTDWDRDGKGLFISTRFGNVPQIHYDGRARSRPPVLFLRDNLLREASRQPLDTPANSGK